jgi:chromosome condensin MukBEF complex kleisin-like MukF subunit
MGDDDSSDQPDAPASVAEVIAEAWHTNFTLNMSREETAFLAGVHAYLLDAPEPSLNGETLRRIFAPVYELAQSETDSEAQRATLKIGRLRAQGILLRTDDSGVTGEGEFTLSPLGLALAKSMEKERELTKRNLSFVLMYMRAVLVDVLRAASHADSAGDWESQVIWPLRDIVVEMIRLVDQRQRGLDAAHKALRQEITELVDSEWADAIDRCVAMIERVHRTLRELNEVLSEHVEHLETQLFDLAAYSGKHLELPRLLDRTRNQLARLALWGHRRYEEWSGYYRNVQIYIRDVVRTDPANLLRSRLTEQIRRFQIRPYALLIVAPEPFLHLRDVIRPAASTPLTVPEEILANRTLSEYAEPPPNAIELAVAALVERLETEGEIDIVAAVREVAPNFIDSQYFQLLMRVTPELLKHGMTAQQILEQAWVKLSERLHAQSLELHLRKNATQSDLDAVDQPFTPSLAPPDPDKGEQP